MNGLDDYLIYFLKITVMEYIRNGALGLLYHIQFYPDASAKRASIYHSFAERYVSEDCEKMHENILAIRR